MVAVNVKARLSRRKGRDSRSIGVRLLVWPGVHKTQGTVHESLFKAEVELKDTEEKYKYISHEVDLLIYSIEPIVAYLGVGEFNEILCGAGRVYLLDHLEFTNIWWITKI